MVMRVTLAGSEAVQKTKATIVAAVPPRNIVHLLANSMASMIIHARHHVLPPGGVTCRGLGAVPIGMGPGSRAIRKPACIGRSRAGGLPAIRSLIRSEGEGMSTGAWNQCWAGDQTPKTLRIPARRNLQNHQNPSIVGFE